MKVFLNSLKQNKRQYLIRILCLIIGIYIFTLSIALYVPTAIGASQVDFTTFNILAIFGKWNKKAKIDTNFYKNALIALYSFLLLCSVVFLSIHLIKKYKKTKDKKIWLELIVLIVLDLIVLFGVSYIIDFQLNILTKIGYKDWMFNSKTPYQYRSIFFLISYVLYVIGLCFWVHSNMLLGPYNSINTSFMKMTNIQFNISRVLMDILIFLPGLILFLVNPVSWELKGKFLLNYVNIGTVLFVLATGPLLGKALNILNKFTHLYN